MATKLNCKGQVTVPKNVRDALGMTPGCAVDIDVDADGGLVIRKVGTGPDRFDAVRGRADVKWRTDVLMAFLRR